MRSKRVTARRFLEPMLKTSTSATFSPSRFAILMQKASFSTLPGNRASSGLMMCVDGVPSTGRPQEPSGILVSKSFSCTPPNESRTRSSTPRGAVRRFRTSCSISSFDKRSALAVVGGGGAVSPAGWITTAPAQSRPIALIIPNVSLGGRSNSSATARRDWPSGRRPSRNGVTMPCENRSGRTGRDSERRGVPNS